MLYTDERSVITSDRRVRNARELDAPVKVTEIHVILCSATNRKVSVLDVND